VGACRRCASVVLRTLSVRDSYSAGGRPPPDLCSLIAPSVNMLARAKLEPPVAGEWSRGLDRVTCRGRAARPRALTAMRRGPLLAARALGERPGGLDGAAL
jgi:hypothetical protein